MPDFYLFTFVFYLFPSAVGHWQLAVGCWRAFQALTSVNFSLFAFSLFAFRFKALQISGTFFIFPKTGTSPPQ